MCRQKPFKIFFIIPNKLKLYLVSQYTTTWYEFSNFRRYKHS